MFERPSHAWSSGGTPGKAGNGGLSLPANCALIAASDRGQGRKDD